MKPQLLRRTLLAGLTSALMAGAAQAESLADAMVAAYNPSGLLDQNRAALRAADEDVAQAVASLRPVISYAASAGYNSNAANNNNRDLTASASLDFSWLIFDAGALAFQREGLKEIVLATRQSLIGVEQDVLLAAVNAYMGVVRETETVALRENNVRLIIQELRAAEDRFEVGEVTRTDVAQAEARLAQARASLAAARGTLVQARAQYQNDVGRMPGALSTPRATPRVPGELGAARGIGGVAVLSRLPVVPGSRECAGNDGMAAMQIETDAGPLWVVALHLHWPWPYRQATQIAGLAPFFEALDGPVLLAGDFNSVRWAHAVDVVAQATGTRHRGPFEPTFYTWPHAYPLGLDHVLASPQMCVRVDVVGPEGSDHNGVLARIDLP